MPYYDDATESDVDQRKSLIAGFYDDNWDKVAEIDNFLYIFDRLPDRMRLMVDFKIEGRTNEDIAKLLKIDEESVERTLRRAKKRFFQGNH